MSNSGYARPVILIWRARDSTPLSSGRRLRSISGSGGGGGRRSRGSPRRKSGLWPPKGRPRSPSGRGAPPPGRGGPRRSPRGRLSSRRGPGGPSRRGGRGPRRSRSPRRSGRSVSPSYLAYLEAEGSCAQAGRKSLSRSNSLSGNVLITLRQAHFAARLANAANAAWSGSGRIASVGWHYPRGPADRSLTQERQARERGNERGANPSCSPSRWGALRRYRPAAPGRRYCLAEALPYSRIYFPIPRSSLDRPYFRASCKAASLNQWSCRIR